MPRHFEKRTLPYSQAQLFDLVADVGRYPEFLPWCLDAKVTQKEHDYFSAELTVGNKALCDSFTSLVHLYPYQLIDVQYVGGPLRYLMNKWSFRSLSENYCEISFEVDFTFKSPVLGMLMDLFFETAFFRMVGAFEKRAEVMYGARK